MRFVLLTAIAAMLVAGCGSASKEITPTEEPSYKIVYDGPTRIPQLDGKSMLEMQIGDKPVRIGAAAESLREIFPKPEKGSDVRELPPRFPDEYISRGWDSDEECVGWLSYSGQVVFVLHTVRHLDESEVQKDYVEKYTKLFRGIEPTVIIGKNAKFWFWQDGPHRFMLCSGRSRKSGVDITEVIGDTAVMDALRMIPSKAEFDKERADSAWAEDARKAASTKKPQSD